MEKEQQQEFEWKEAQSILINVDLVSAAKKQLEFLAAVDRNRWLYEGHGLDKAIYRYNACWLPLLAKHSESPLFEGPLVIPFDCEWVWHCHRLNPVRYKSDCLKFYGRILDNDKVVSSLEGTSRNSTEETWKSLFVGEPFELDLANALQDKTHVNGLEKFTKYDLISAVQRQGPFFYQVSRLHMNDTRYLEGAVARYKGFLHLIKRNKEKSIQSFSVPTYDIDLIWHTHQLHPASYCKDLMKIMGKILEHDDTDSDRTKGQKLDVGYSGTTKTFEDMYGRRYWRAGAMYRGSAPLPIRTTPYTGISTKKAVTFDEPQKSILPQRKVLEVMLEFVGLRNLPEEHKGSLYVSFSKTQPDEIFNAKRILTIYSESGNKQVASFQCEPTGHLLFELISSFPTTKSSKVIGTISMPLEDFLSPESNLTEEKWLDLVPTSNNSKPIGLRVAISVTIPTPAPYILHMTQSRMFPKKSCLFPLPVKVQSAKSWTDVVDDAGNLVMSLQIRDSKKSMGKKECAKREVVCVMESGETRTLAEFAESKWSIVNSPWSLQLPKSNTDDGHLLELNGLHTVRLYSGGRLDYESRRCEKHKVEHGKPDLHLITAVEFSAKEPYGRAIALLDLKSGIVKVKEEWFLMPCSILSFILGIISKKEGYNNLIVGSKSQDVKGSSNEEVGSEKEVETVKKNGLMSAKVGAGCGGGCGSGCGNAVMSIESGGCGGCGGGMRGDMVKSGGCGSGCGGGCGDMVKSGGCGSGCGGGCGDMVKSGGCGSGCGGGCGDMVKSGGCGSGCGGGCGDMVKSGGESGDMVNSGGCGSGCGGECGDMVKSGGCGSGCGGGGGCGDMINSSMEKCGGCGGGSSSNNKQVSVPGNEVVVV